MAPHLGLQRIMIPSAQVSSLTTGSITLPSARGAFADTSFDSIGSFVFTGSETSVTFDNISANYDHLQVRFFGRTTTIAAGNAALLLTVNDYTTSNTSFGRMYSTGSTQSGDVTTGSLFESSIGVIPNNSHPANYFGGGIIDLFNANNATQKKIYQGFMGSQPGVTTTDARVAKTTYLIQDTARVSKIICSIAGGATWAAGSTVSLCGILGS
jgi:hypothetical protein